MIKLKNIKKNFYLGGETIRALDDVNFNVKMGEFVSIIGPSGSGKSTLMNILGLLDVPDSGDYYLDGINVSKASENELARIRNNKIGFIFQNFNLLGKMTAVENIQIPMIYQGKTNEESKERAYKLLEKVGLKGRENHLPTQLSGGQQQRVAIARAIGCNPEIILADEPTGALDSKTSIDIMNELENLNNKGQTIIIITHDINVAKRAKRIVKIDESKINLITLGQNAIVEISSYEDKKIEGNITNISNTASNGKFTVTIEFENDGEVMIGMSALVTIKE